MPDKQAFVRIAGRLCALLLARKTRCYDNFGRPAEREFGAAPHRDVLEKEFPMTMLDTPSAYQALDAGRMLHFLHELHEVAEAAFERGAAVRLPLEKPSAILICGMGGSAISGDLIRTQLLGACDVP